MVSQPTDWELGLRCLSIYLSHLVLHVGKVDVLLLSLPSQSHGLADHALAVPVLKVDQVLCTHARTQHEIDEEKERVGQRGRLW